MPMQKAILGMMSVASNMLAQTVANSTISSELQCASCLGVAILPMVE